MCLLYGFLFEIGQNFLCCFGFVVTIFAFSKVNTLKRLLKMEQFRSVIQGKPLVILQVRLTNFFITISDISANLVWFNKLCGNLCASL